jgi:hypothetical protein
MCGGVREIVVKQGQKLKEGQIGVRLQKCFYSSNENTGN